MNGGGVLISIHGLHVNSTPHSFLQKKKTQKTAKELRWAKSRDPNRESLAILKTRDSNRWRPCDLKLRFETRDWRFVLNIPIQQNCEKGCDLSPRSEIASDWRLAILPI